MAAMTQQQQPSIVIKKSGVSDNNADSGYGLFCNVPIEQNAVIFQDTPLFSLQHTGNRRFCTNCAYCSRFVPCIGTQLESMFGDEPHFQPMLEKILPYVEKWQSGLGAASTMVKCQCGERYCSEQCRLADWTHSHEILCVASCESQTDALVEFKMHSIEFIETMMLAAKVMAHLVQKVRRGINLNAAGNNNSSGSSSSSSSSSTSSVPQQQQQQQQLPPPSMKLLMQELLEFCHGDFLDVCRPPPNRPKDDEFKKETAQTLSQGFFLLKSHFAKFFNSECQHNKQLARELELLFADEKFFTKILGLFEVCNVDLQVDSFLTPFFANHFANVANQKNADEAAAYEELLRSREVLTRCVWDDSITGNYDVDDDEEFEDDEDEEGMEEEGQEQQSRKMNNAEDNGLECVDCPPEEMTLEEAGGNGIPDFLWEQIRAEVAAISGADLLAKEWPAYHATAFSAKIARCNHSCEPNMKFFFDNGNHVMSARALRPIRAGEELFVCYVEDSDPVEKRQKMLREYGFDCRCVRCVRELATGLGGA
ncbi:unnamed protein product [Amoebophrya sp. A120]|nr:unnamed protein product [Amoebophrya sp. A120]|eukprot:GSA120T00001207001.1